MSLGNEVGVWIEYHWTCSECEDEQCNSYMPTPGEDLLCQSCGNLDRCGDVTENCRPSLRLSELFIGRGSKQPARKQVATKRTPKKKVVKKKS